MNLILDLDGVEAYYTHNDAGGLDDSTEVVRQHARRVTRELVEEMDGGVPEGYAPCGHRLDAIEPGCDGSDNALDFVLVDGELELPARIRRVMESGEAMRVALFAAATAALAEKGVDLFGERT